MGNQLEHLPDEAWQISDPKVKVAGSLQKRLQRCWSSAHVESQVAYMTNLRIVSVAENRSGLVKVYLCRGWLRSDRRSSLAGLKSLPDGISSLQGWLAASESLQRARVRGNYRIEQLCRLGVAVGVRALGLGLYSRWIRLEHSGLCAQGTA